MLARSKQTPRAGVRSSAGQEVPAVPDGAVAFWDIPLNELLPQLGADRDGLSQAEAEGRLRECGPNRVAPRHRAGPLAQFFRFFLNPLVLILLIASAVSAALGEPVSTGIIALIVLLSAALNFVQSYRSQGAVEALQRLVTTHATVLRDGTWMDVDPQTLVTGDVIRLGVGDLVPADARLLEAHDLSINQAALTGESLPVEKKSADLGPGPHALADAANAVFSGSSVAAGVATAVIARTGRATAYGGIAQRLATRPPETEFERGLRRFSLLIAQTVLFLVLFVFMINTLRDRPPLESFLFAVALAVGLTPEFLPMIVAVTLARGASRMAQRKVIVRHLPAIENVGSMDILCSDKTGTLTRGDMTFDRAVNLAGADDAGVLRLAALNAAYQTGLSSPLDAAILQAARPAEPVVKIDEMPFDFTRRRLSVVLESSGERLIITKGAPEAVLAACATCAVDGRVVSLDGPLRDGIHATFAKISDQGRRSVAVASRPAPSKPDFTPADETGLTFAGFVTFSDPLREDASASLEALRRDGVEVKILTGDNELVARRICEQVGLPVDQFVLGSEVDTMSDAALGQVAEQVALFARVSPEQKHRIVLALKRRGHVVGYLGDGINDAPSLHSADVGISVQSAVDIAKEAAELVLLERGLSVIHDGVIEGRRAFGNVMKYVMMGTSSNFGNVLSMAAATVVLPYLPLLPTQVLLNNFLYDLAQVTIPTDRVDDAYIRRPERWDVHAIRDFMVLMGPVSSLFDFLTFAALLLFFHMSEAAFHTGWFIESLASQTLIIFLIRTVGNPLRSRPSRALALSAVGVVAIGLVLPFTPLAGPLGFVRPPLALLAFLLGVVIVYLFLAELAKRAFYRHRGRSQLRLSRT